MKLSSSTLVLVLSGTALAAARGVEERQILEDVTSVAGDVTSVAGGVFSDVTSFGAGAFSTVTSFVPNEFSTVTSAVNSPPVLRTEVDGFRLWRDFLL